MQDIEEVVIQKSFYNKEYGWLEPTNSENS